ncbi:MAG TPA: hypothetical protein VLL54_02950 [Pyrinomonadaceae bacterium]|nr:hypothetical protein [Pyrinomonadaceae bacterium]
MKARYSTILATAGIAFLFTMLPAITAPTFSKAQTQSLQIVAATLTASPEVYDGQCPVTIKFSGSITVKGKGKIQYTFLRSDGAIGPVYTLDFDSDGTKTVDTTWTLGGSPFAGWQAIKILSPYEMESNRADFKGSCSQEKPSLPQGLSVPTFPKAPQQEPQQTLQVVSATLTASPEVFDGKCPVTINFNGNITVKGTGKVTYTFVRSDGATGPVQTLNFSGEDTRSVDASWALNLPAFNGWESIRILLPNEVESNQAFFKGTCLAQEPSPNVPVPPPAPEPSVEGPSNRSVVYPIGRNWDFEDGGLVGWTATGTAFTNQPTLGDNVFAERVRTDMTLEGGGIGGDYWKRVPYPIGHHLGAWIGTKENHPNAAATLGIVAGDERIGTLTSGEFPLDEAHRFIAFMVGGGRDVTTERVELQIRGENDNDIAELTRLIAGNRNAAAGLAALFGGSLRPAENGVGSRDGNYLIALSASGQNSEVMRPIVFEVPSALRGRQGRIRIIDNSREQWGHINVDDFRFGVTRPPDRAVPLWGFADTHAHPMNDLAFGGNLIQGSLYARDGSAFGSDSYRKSALPAMFDSLDQTHARPLSQLLPVFGLTQALSASHLIRSGYPEMQGYPNTTQMAGQTMYGEWIHRAYDGGLRLMSALAVNTWVISSHPIKRAVLGSPQPEDDKGSTDVQVLDIKTWASRPENRSWVEIALTSADARRIIGSNKLAIVIGIELDTLGNFVPNGHFKEPGAVVMPDNPDLQRALIIAELDRLHLQGVRQICPFHYVNGVWGGTAMSQRFFNDVNRAVTGNNVEVASGAEQGIRYRLDMDGWGPAGVASRTLLTQDSPAMQHGANWESTRLGHVNAMGLTTAGKILFEEMTKRGFLIDTDHSSHRSTDGMLELALARDYPLLTSHSDYLELGLTGPGDFTYVGFVYDDNANLRNFDTTLLDPLRNERMVTRNTLRTIAQLRGTTGAIMWLPRRMSWGNAVPNDCDGSSKTWAQAYQYAVEQMGGHGVALSTDRITLYPRFGPNASYMLGAESASMPQRDERRFRQVDAQHNGVRYDVPLREWGAFRFKLALGSTGAWEKTPVRDSSSSDSSTWESHPVEIGDAWMALAAFTAGRNPRTMPNHGIDGGNRVVDYAWGFFATSEDDLVLDGARLPGSLDSRIAAYCVKNGITPNGIRRLTVGPRALDEYWWVKRAWDEWQRMSGSNEPLRRHIFGYRELGRERISRDFDINIDGAAHYGMIPDVLQDVANSHPRPTEVGAYFDPLFRSAEDYIRMWEKAESRAAALRR